MLTEFTRSITKDPAVFFWTNEQTNIDFNQFRSYLQESSDIVLYKNGNFFQV